MKVAKYTNSSIGVLLITIRQCQIGSCTYEKGSVFKVINKSETNTDNIKIQKVSGTLMAEWADVGTDERMRSHRLRLLYKNEEKLWITE